MFFHKTGCARQSDSKLSLRSLALFFHKTGCARQFDSKLSLRSLALFLYKTGCARQSESKLSLRSLALFFHKTGCARQFDSKLSLRSLALFFNKRDGILRIIYKSSSRCMSGRFVTAVFTCLCNSLSHNGLRNGLFGLAKEAFPHHERASSAVSKRLFRKPEKPVSPNRCGTACYGMGLERLVTSV